MDNPNFVDPYANMNLDTTGQNVAEQGVAKMSEEDSRKLILESYEKAGVDLPLVTLETVLDREIAEDDARQTGAPRFKKFLNKASSAVANRLQRVESMPRGPDDEVDELSVPSVSSYTSNFKEEYETPPPPPPETLPALMSVPVPVPVPMQPEDPAENPQTPERSANIPSTTADGAAMIPPTPESGKLDCHPTFDFCCPNKPNSSPAKYVVSNLQLPEGFEDEQQSVENQEPRDVPALMDTDVSMMDESSFKVDHSEDDLKGRQGFIGFFRGSRRFRYAVVVCCLLHLILVGLIIAFVMSGDNDGYGTGSSSASIPQGQTTTAAPSTNNGDGFVTSKTLIPDPDLVEEIFANATDTISNSNNVTVVEEDVITAASNSTGSCVDTLEVNMDCLGVDSELFVSFEVCTPQAGDWVAIFDSSADPQSLSDEDAIGWLYTCGDRFCEETVQKENLSFTRAKERAVEGSYRAHLLREGEGTVFSAIASSTEFRIITDANGSC